MGNKSRRKSETTTSSNAAKREIRRQVRQYEESFQTLGASLLRADLQEACRSHKAVDQVALISYAWAKAKVAKNNAGTLERPRQHHTSKLALIHEITNLLWQDPPYPRKDSPFVWAVEANAKDVIRFMIAWKVLDSLASMTERAVHTWNASESSGSSGRCESIDTQKHSLITWLDVLHVPIDKFHMECLDLYPSLRSRRYTLRAVMDCLITPHVLYFPDIPKMLLQTFMELAPRDQPPSSQYSNLKIDEMKREEEEFLLIESPSIDEEETDCEEAWEVLSAASTIISL